MFSHIDPKSSRQWNHGEDSEIIPKWKHFSAFEDQCVIMIQQRYVPLFEQWLLNSGWLMIGSGIVCTVPLFHGNVTVH